MPVLTTRGPRRGGRTVVTSGWLNDSGRRRLVRPDGGSITKYEWDLKNNGTYRVTGATPSLSYDYLVNTLGLHPNRNGHPIALRVTDSDADMTAERGQDDRRHHREDLLQPPRHGQGPDRVAR